MMLSMRRVAHAAALTGAMLAYGAAGRAEDETLADLDLSSHAGRVLARTRINVAAREACEAADVRQLHVAADYLRCRATALDGASVQLQALVLARRAPSVTVTDTR